jgi:hypothetical protein
MNIIAVTGRDVSSAWLAACRSMADGSPVAYHTVVRIEDPLAEDSAVRAAVDGILEGARLQPLKTVANTIFPEAVAATSRDHLHLARRYTDMLPTLRLMSGANTWGTYFGRLVSYPGPRGPVNQLDAIITRLRSETAKAGTGTGPLTAAYEAAFAAPGEEAGEGDGAASQDGCLATLHAQVRVPGQDSRVRGFPCLSHCSFQLDRSGALHAMAHYRSHVMVERAYGNYVGLGRLLGYIAGQAGLRTGELTVTAGYATLDQRKRLGTLLGAQVPQQGPAARAYSG